MAVANYCVYVDSKKDMMPGSCNKDFNKQVRVLTLNDDVHQDSTLYRLRISWFVQFKLGPTLLSSNDVSIFCNHPVCHIKARDDGYVLLPWQNSSVNKLDKTDAYAECEITEPGTYQYFYQVNLTTRGSGYFIVDPVLTVGPDERHLPLDCICMQTVLSKLLGPFSMWRKRLQVSKESGYNVIHFTPLQELGMSNSSYSISDQLMLNSEFTHQRNSLVTWKEVKNFVSEMQRDWSMLSVTDVVWNHTSKNSEWLTKYPESAFNLKNCPYLRPAYILDRAIYYLAINAGRGALTGNGIPSIISSETDLQAIECFLLKTVIPKLKIWEFYQVDIDDCVNSFVSAVNSSSLQQIKDTYSLKTIDILQDMQFRRFKCNVDFAVAVQQFYYSMKEPLLEVAKNNFKSALIWLNQMKRSEIQSDLNSAIHNIILTIRYERLDGNGPKKVSICEDSPLVTEYFYQQFPAGSVEKDEAYIDVDDHAQYIMAHNGWVMNDDPLKNFAEHPTKTYLRRELVSWGDCVKLNYGKSPEDCPPLWQRMKEYTELTAEIFHGIRIDNCHSTPIHVAEYMLKAGRKKRPNLYVFAELFTENESVDNIFVNKLGINSLIREGMSAHDSHELGRLLYKYGGEPVASFVKPNIRPLMPSVAHALLYDVTHDNESDIQKRTPLNPLPFSALVSMACCAIGSNRGHDELVPHHIHVVSENRLYNHWSDSAAMKKETGLTTHSGLIKERLVLNQIHQTTVTNGFTQVFVDQRDTDVVAVTRHNPITHHSYILIAHTAFSSTVNHKVEPMVVEGNVESIAFECKPQTQQIDSKLIVEEFQQNSDVINGLMGISWYSDVDVNLSDSCCCQIQIDGGNNNKQKIVFTDFPPGSVIIFRVKLHEDLENHACEIRSKVKSIMENADGRFSSILSSLNLFDMNRVLFRCDAEEQSDGLGIAAYEFPGWGRMKYCGLQGIASIFGKIRTNNDLGHPVCQNLRDGDWVMDYISSRLQKVAGTAALGNWLESIFEHISQLPRYLVPSYFDMLLLAVYPKILHASWDQMSPFVSHGSSFVKTLALGSVALHGVVTQAGLPDVSSSEKERASLAAGFPHFSTGIMRCWGRDTFIALRGLILIPGRFDEAKELVLGFASCVRHGLIPNLLGEGKICRYNCRDAVWWWLQCIQDICETCKDGYDLLQSSVGRIYPSDDDGPDFPPRKQQPLCDVIQECLQRHVDGIKFKERGAGTTLDMNMSDDGFFVEAGVNLNTGFVYGGSKYNCGTWMDKMGESIKAGTKGVPATPRDGSAVELVALCKSAVNWLLRANNSGKYPYDGVFVQGASTTKLTWREWDKKILDNFEPAFYVSETDQSHLVHKRFIYKDTFGATHPWCDYQLRPNFPIAMVVAPELFDRNHAWNSLLIVKAKLLGPLGMKTLDSDDMMYRGDYDNSNDSDDSSVAKGFNYHQGPEWVWPVGYFLRALLYFAHLFGPKTLADTVNFIQGYLSSHHLHVENSEWKGLPELTNSNGARCEDSCEIQAWSNATILEVLHDLDKRAKFSAGANSPHGK